MMQNVGTDWNLCQNTWQSIIDRHGESPTANDFNSREFVIVAVWTVYGIVDNGGFEYLFEGDLPGDPGYQRSLAAFRTIGCAEALWAFEEALSLFPGGVVPKDSDERNEVFRANPEAIRNAIACRFWDSNDEIVSKLAEYIRKEFME
jgi:hypothetical protein